MYQKISEPIQVIVAFKKDGVEPVVFKWNGRQYKVDRVNLVHTERLGREKFFIFSVSDNVNAYRLRFSTETLKWQLEAMAML